MTSSAKFIPIPLELDLSHVEFTEKPTFIFAPYVPLQVTQAIAHHDSISKTLAKAGLKLSKLGVSTRYSKKVSLS
jgi:hypothetical protein